MPRAWSATSTWRCRSSRSPIAGRGLPEPRWTRRSATGSRWTTASWPAIWACPSCRRRRPARAGCRTCCRPSATWRQGGSRAVRGGSRWSLPAVRPALTELVTQLGAGVSRAAQPALGRHAPARRRRHDCRGAAHGRTRAARDAGPRAGHGGMSMDPGTPAGPAPDAEAILQNALRWRQRLAVTCTSRWSKPSTPGAASIADRAVSRPGKPRGPRWTGRSTAS